MNKHPYRLDRTKFKMQSFSEASHQLEYWKNKSLDERLKAAVYLISVAYGYDFDNPLRLNRTVFSMRKHSK